MLIFLFHGGSSLNSEDPDECWIIGGPLGARNTVLRFRCSALSDPPVHPPAHELHMTYKTIQAETKLLSAVLCSHGMREVSKKMVLSSLFITFWSQVFVKRHFNLEILLGIYRAPEIFSVPQC
jgi:hypothetical protein